MHNNNCCSSPTWLTQVHFLIQQLNQVSSASKNSSKAADTTNVIEKFSIWSQQLPKPVYGGYVLAEH